MFICLRYVYLCTMIERYLFLLLPQISKYFFSVCRGFTVKANLLVSIHNLHFTKFIFKDNLLKILNPLS